MISYNSNSSSRSMSFWCPACKDDRPDSRGIESTSQWTLFNVIPFRATCSSKVTCSSCKGAFTGAMSLDDIQTLGSAGASSLVSA